ncbi:MAG: Asp-tRNA(Asn)/Glu-tRNA(Gln) amidotransferase subunit GatB [Spirochaetales bacterium]|nr:Asp-tRNA(Asn)/Glu-tRNA(Gln) amidotransferase subunit GatB [Spirochaetales bacterium]
MKYDVIIGCEVHVQLSTKSKAFCTCRNVFGGEPNSRVCPVCLGLPGSLPVPNKEHIRSAIKAGRALGCSIAPLTKFDRKNYMYPDLPKAYQISQYDMPICNNGMLTVFTQEGTRDIRILRIHMEEDTGKNIHADDGSHESYVDYNRSGTPLLEIVSEPDMRSPAEAAAFVMSIHEIMQYLEISDCNMEEGSLRCDANINLWVYEEEKKYATPIVEIKNMNSFKAIQAALEYEVQRQADEWQNHRLTREAAGKSTRGWNEASGKTILQRTKEEEADYRYFPEPDLKPLSISADLIQSIEKTIGELPKEKRERFMHQLGLSETDTIVLTTEKAFADYFEQILTHYPNPKKTANWLLGEVKKYLNAGNISISDFRTTPAHIAELLLLQESGKISGKMAKDVFIKMAATGKAAQEIVSAEGLSQISDRGELEKIVIEVIAANPGSADDYRNGKLQAIKFLMGQVMKASKGKANPQEAEKLLSEKLSS